VVELVAELGFEFTDGGSTAALRFIALHGATGDQFPRRNQRALNRKHLLLWWSHFMGAGQSVWWTGRHGVVKTGTNLVDHLGGDASALWKPIFWLLGADKS